MIVNVYHKTIPNLKNQEKIDLLKFYSRGVNVCGDKVNDIHDFNYRPSDVGVVQGWVHDESKKSAHLSLRKTIIESQIARNKYVLAVDSNLFLYANTNNPLHYLRYSFNGIFPNTGIYCDKIIDPSRWLKISKDLNLTLKDYRSNGNHILLLLQRNGGWSMGGLDVQEWAVQTINQIRQFSNRPIVIRAHPGDKSAKLYLDPNNPKCKIKFSKDIRLSTNPDLLTDLKNCWAAVNYNSSPVVGAAIEGIPIFVIDPNKSQCAEIANIDLSKIENPSMPDRQQWVERLSMFHWKFDELRSGECWSHMKLSIV